MSHLDSLAGLDSMVLHINTHSSNPSPTLPTSLPLDSESYVLVPRKRRKLARPHRTPLADKTPAINTPQHSLSKPGVPLHKRDVSITIVQGIPSEPTPSTVSSRRNSIRCPSFKPLPPVPAGSPLRTSFLDLSPPPASPLSESHSGGPGPPTAAPSSLLPQRSCAELAPADSREPRVPPARKKNIHDETFLIPAFQHPNSPYVPWAAPVRRKILRPLHAPSHVSVLSSCYSRPLSRSGARAPEPAETPVPGIHNFSPVAKGWSKVRQKFVNGFRFLNAFKRRSSVQRPESPSILETERVSVSQADATVAHEDDIFAANYSPESATPLAVLTGRRELTLSMASFASSDSTTLAAWLAARRQAEAEERNYDPNRAMSVEEYERKGSWLNLSGNGADPKTWVCGVPGCDIHERHMMLHGQVTTLDFSMTTDTFTFNQGKRRSAQVFPSSASKNRSSPHLSRHSRMSVARPRTASGTHAVDLRAGLGLGPPPLPTPQDVSSQAQREKEGSMPGGWSFSSS